MFVNPRGDRRTLKRRTSHRPRRRKGLHRMLENLLFSAGSIAVGFVLLNQGAKFITDNATRISGRIGRSRFVFGALFVSTLSALPELLVSGIAAEEGSPDIALGNALASTVVTIAFVIGVSALVRPIKTSREIVLRDAVFLAIVSLVAATLLLDGNLTQYEGVALIALFVPYILNLAISQRTGPADEIEERVEDMTIGLQFTGWIFGRKVEVRAGLSWLIFGVLWSVMGAQFLVQGAINLSTVVGMSPWFVGITLVALGTSLPDIAAAYHATRRGYTDLVLGEGIGAAVVATAGLFPAAGGDALPATGRAEFHFLDESPLFVPTVLGPAAARRGGLSGPTSGGGSRLHARWRRGWSAGHRGRGHRHRMRSGVLHHPELFFHVGALVDPRDRRPRDPVEEALPRVALRGGTNEAVDQDKEWEDFRDISDHRMHDVEVPVDRDDPEREDFLADGAGENRLEQDRVDEPDRPPEEQNEPPGPCEEREGDGEEQSDDDDHDGVEQEGDEPTDPMLLQSRIVTDQIECRRHV